MISKLNKTPRAAKILAVVGLCLLTQGAWAQSSGAAQPSSPEKKQLVAQILKLQQGGIEVLARGIAERPAAQLIQQAGLALQRLPVESREAVARDIEADARKYAEEAVPIVRNRALQLAPTTVGPILESNFSEDELRQLITMLESPLNKRFQSMAPEMQRALTEKLVAESRGEIEPKVRAMEQSVIKRLGGTQTAPPAGGSSAPIKK